MKKFLLIAAIVLCVSASVFADGFIGAEAGFDINWMNQKIKGQGEGMDMSTMAFDVGLSGAHYFTDSIGLGYGLGLQFPFQQKYEDSDYMDIEDAQTTFKGDLSFQFKHDFSEKMALEAGAGMYFIYYSESSVSTIQLGAQGNVGIAYKIVSSLALRAGAKLYVPFYTSQSMNGHEVDMSVFGVGLVPYIGLAFAY